MELAICKKSMEICLLTIHGQSFMLHQIRKMVAFVSYLMRGIFIPPEYEHHEIDKSADERFFEYAFTSVRLSIPKAPADPLFLNRLHYDNYNSRYGSDGMHVKILESNSSIDSDIEKFKREKIIPKIAEKLVVDNIMLEWLAYSITMPCMIYSPFNNFRVLTGIQQARINLNLKKMDEMDDEEPVAHKLSLVEREDFFVM
ncbi:hypothetical protein ACOME3_008052 [Neoechinorhynchus agilis]